MYSVMVNLLTAGMEHNSQVAELPETNVIHYFWPPIKLNFCADLSIYALDEILDMSVIHVLNIEVISDCVICRNCPILMIPNV